MNAFERIFNRICFLVFDIVGKFLLLLCFLYGAIGTAYLLGLVVGGLLGFSYLGWEEDVGWVLGYAAEIFGWGLIVGVVYFLICMTLFMIAGVYWLLTGKEDLGGGWL